MRKYLNLRHKFITLGTVDNWGNWNLSRSIFSPNLVFKIVWENLTLGLNISELIFCFVFPVEWVVILVDFGLSFSPLDIHYKSGLWHFAFQRCLFLAVQLLSHLNPRAVSLPNDHHLCKTAVALNWQEWNRWVIRN